MGPRLWLVEGLPGSGRSTFAERLCEAARIQGLAARWWLEEAKDHPVLPSTLRRSSLEPGFTGPCIAAFDAFLNVEVGVLILEGAAFQNTVRFLFANGASRDEIDAYILAWARGGARASPRLMMFQVAAPSSE